jgi:hypothetical protein
MIATLNKPFKQLLGKRLPCQWIWMGNEIGYKWVCFTSGGGMVIYDKPNGTMLGKSITPEPLEPSPSGFDPITWIKENPLIAGGIALALILLLRK